ncbi:MAG: CHAT domain-containing protein [Myxococcales bacterium]|nr:CHAT domain-containing protein [Myxococcales bacterium]
MSVIVQLELEFARARDTDDPYAFTFAPQTYILRTPDGRSWEVAIDWSAELIERLGALQRPDADPALARALGTTLRELLEPAGWGAIESTLTAEIVAERPVHMTIRSAAAEIYALPWELLMIRGIGLPLGAISTVLLRYEWPATRTRPAATPPRGRLLVAWSDAGGEVPHEQHLLAIERTAGAPSAVLPRVSLRALSKALGDAERDGQGYDALHLLCHGGVEGRDCGLLLHRDVDTYLGAEGDAALEHAARLVSADALARALVPHADMLRLVVIAACSSGDAGVPVSRLGGVAQMLHRAGVQAVVASRLPLSVIGSRRLTEALYRALYRDRVPLERAVLSAKQALGASASDDHDWATLQLYARARDGDATDILGLIEAAAPDPGDARATTELAPAPSQFRRPPSAPEVTSIDVSAPPSLRGSPRWLWPAIALGSVLAVCLTIIVVSAPAPEPVAAREDDTTSDEPTRAIASPPATTRPEPPATAADPRPPDPLDHPTASAEELAASPALDTPGAKQRRKKPRKQRPTLGIIFSSAAGPSSCAPREPCSARFQETNKLMRSQELRAALERCYDGLPPESFIDKDGHRGQQWVVNVHLTVSAQGTISVDQVTSSARGATPKTCVREVVAARALGSSALAEPYKIRVSFENSDGVDAMRYVGWDPETIADEDARERSG